MTIRRRRTCGSPKGDPRSDIYFLGCVFYQMLTGKLPMEEAESKDMLRKMLKRSFGAIKPIAEHQYAPDEDLCQIVEKMMKVNLKARYQTLDDIVAELGRYRAALEEGVKLGRIAAPAGESIRETRNSTRFSPFRQRAPRPATPRRSPRSWHLTR